MNLFQARLVTLCFNACLIIYSAVYLKLCPQNIYPQAILLSYAILNVLLVVIIWLWKRKKTDSPPNVGLGALVGLVKTVPCATWHFLCTSDDDDHCSFYDIATFIWTLILSGELFVLVATIANHYYYYSRPPQSWINGGSPYQRLVASSRKEDMT